MDLSLLEQSVAIEAQGLGKTGSVLPNRGFVVAETEPQVEAVVRRRAHTTKARREPVGEAVSVEEAGSQDVHFAVSTTAESTRLRFWRVSEPDNVILAGGSAGAGTSLWIGFNDEMADPSNQDPSGEDSLGFALRHFGL